MKRIGRPPLFVNREKVVVFIDASDVPALRAAAERARLSMSSWARAVLVEAAARDAQSAATTAAVRRRRTPRRARAARDARGG
jgi:hypothetical protein